MKPGSVPAGSGSVWGAEAHRATRGKRSGGALRALWVPAAAETTQLHFLHLIYKGGDGTLINRVPRRTELQGLEIWETESTGKKSVINRL